MKKLLLALSLGAVVSTTNAQNDVPVNSESVKFQTDLRTVFPEEVTKVSADINKSVKDLLLSFAAQSATFENIYLGFILTQMDTDLYKALKAAFAKNKNLPEKAYTALLPAIKDVFKKMTAPEQKMYLDYFQGGIKYLETFDIKKEMADMERLDASGDRSQSFCRARGALNAFLFRRISNSELSQKECLAWIKRILSDLTGAVTPKTREEDNYCITQKLDGGFFLAKKLDVGASHVLMKKNGEQYAITSVGDTKKMVTTPTPQSLYAPMIVSDGKNTWVVFEMNNGSHRLFMLRPDAPVLSVEIIAPQSMGLGSILRLSDSFWFLQAYGAFNLTDKGTLEFVPVNEILPVVADPKGAKSSLLMGKYSHGDVYVPTNIKALQKMEYTYYFLTNDNKLYVVCRFGSYGERYRTVFDLTEMPTSFSRLNNETALLSYRNGTSVAFLPFNNEKKIYEMQIPIANITDIQIIEWSDAQRYALVTTSEKMVGLINRDNQILIEPKYSHLTVYESTDYFYFEKHGSSKKGLVDTRGKELIANKYDCISLSNVLAQGKTCAMVGVEYDNTIGGCLKYGISDLSNNLLLPCEFKGIASCPEGNVFFMGKEQSGAVFYAMYSSDLKQLTPFVFSTHTIYDTVVTFDPETFQEIVVSFPLERLWMQVSASSPFVVLKQNGKKVLYDFSGKMLIPSDWDDILLTPIKSMIEVRKDKMVGLVNAENKIVVPAAYSSIVAWQPQTNTSLRFIAHNSKGLYEAFDANGKSIALPANAQVHHINDIPVCFVGKMVDGAVLFAICDANFKPITPFSFSAPIEKSVVFDPETFQEISVTNTIAPGTKRSLKNKTFILQTNNRMGVYDFTGKAIIPAEYTAINILETTIANDFYSAGKPEAVALFDSKGNRLTDFMYEYISKFDGTHFFAARGGKHVRLDIQGKEVK